MTSELKCPFCQTELHKDPDGYYSCYTDNCSVMNAGGNGASGTESLWTALTQVKEDLKDCQHNYSVKSEQHERGYAYATKTIKDLESKLEITRKALKVYSSDSGNWWYGHEFQGRYEDYAGEYADEALEQINHKE